MKTENMKPLEFESFTPFSFAPTSCRTTRTHVRDKLLEIRVGLFLR